MLIIFFIMGAFHFFFRHKFFGLTEKIQANQESPIKLFDIWNFLFYLSIGLAIVLAVQAGGVIPVFSYLIIPPVAAILLTRNDKVLVIVSLIISFLAGLFGIYFSIQYDFPAGPSIVTILSIIFFLAGLSAFFKRKLAKWRFLS